MDPDEGGGAPPRRSRRIQQLNPLSSDTANDTHSTTTAVLEDASASQYHVPTPYPTTYAFSPNSQHSSQFHHHHPYLSHASNDDDTSTIATNAVPTTQHSSGLSSGTPSDPPEQNTQVQSHHSVHSTVSNPYRSPSSPSFPVSIQLPHRSASVSSQPHLHYITTQQFNQLQDIVQNLRTNLQDFQSTAHQQSTNIHRDMAHLNHQM